MDEDGVKQLEGDRVVDEVEWSQLIEVAIRTTPEGPWAEDFFWLLEKSGGGGLVVPQSAATELGLLQRLQRLPSFDNEKVIQATGSVNDETFICWSSSGDKPRDAGDNQ